jgi:hypothetical protein
MKPASVVDIKNRRMRSVDLLPDVEGGVFVIEGDERTRGLRIAVNLMRLHGARAERNVSVPGLASADVKNAQTLANEAISDCIEIVEPGVFKLLEGAAVSVSEQIGTNHTIVGPVTIWELHPPQIGA